MVLIVTKLHALLTCLLLWSVLTSCIYDHHVLTKTQMIMFVQDFKIFFKIFIYSRPIAGIGAKMEHEQTYIQTYKMARETHL